MCVKRIIENQKYVFSIALPIGIDVIHSESVLLSPEDDEDQIPGETRHAMMNNLRHLPQLEKLKANLAFERNSNVDNEFLTDTKKRLMYQPSLRNKRNSVFMLDQSQSPRHATSMILEFLVITPSRAFFYSGKNEPLEGSAAEDSISKRDIQKSGEEGNPVLFDPPIVGSLEEALRYFEDIYTRKKQKNNTALVFMIDCRAQHAVFCLKAAETLRERIEQTSNPDMFAIFGYGDLNLAKQKILRRCLDGFAEEPVNSEQIMEIFQLFEEHPIFIS
jgi:hypothetical protein